MSEKNKVVGGQSTRTSNSKHEYLTTAPGLATSSVCTNGYRNAVVQDELYWHENESYRRHRLDFLLYDPPAFDVVVDTGISFLQAAKDELVLDIGGGEGKETAELIMRGMKCVCLDLSRSQLSRARNLIQEQNPAAHAFFVQANAEEAPFADDSFRILYGKAILHHLDLEIVGRELNRLLKSNGRASFAEPLAHHPLFWLARRLTPKLRTSHEQPIHIDNYIEFAEQFNWHELDVFYLLAPLSYLFRLSTHGEKAFRKTHSILSRIDNLLFRLIPRLRRLAWYGLVNVRK